MLERPAPAYGEAVLPAGTGRLEFRKVSTSSVLDGLDLVIPGGGSVAVVGRSGSGKSLLAALAGRLADPDEGEVLLDGVPLSSLDRAALRHAVGYAFARPSLFGPTIADAIGGDAVTAARSAARTPSSAAFPSATARRRARRRCPAVSSSGSAWRARSPTRGAC